MQKYYKNPLTAIISKLSNYLKTLKIKICGLIFSKHSAPSPSDNILSTNIDENTANQFSHFKINLNRNPSGFIYDELESDTDNLYSKLDNNIENNIIIINLSHSDITYESESHNKLPADAIDKELKNLLIPFPSSTRIH